MVNKVMDYIKNKYLHFKYIEKEDMCGILADMYIRAFYKAPTNIKKLMYGLYPIDFKNYLIFNYIQTATLSAENRREDLSKAEERIKKIFKDTVSFEHDEGNFKIILPEKEIEVTKLDYFLKDFVNKESIDELLSENRRRICHCRSLELSQVAQNSTVATATVYQGVKLNSYLHSWVESKNQDNKDICVDWTLNAIMYKQDYYELFHINEKDVNIIDNSTIINDEKNIDKMIEDKNIVAIKEYVTKKQESEACI